MDRRYRVDRLACHSGRCAGGFVGGCGSSLTTGQIVTISATATAPATLVTDGFDTRDMEAAGWNKVHPNVLIQRR